MPKSPLFWRQADAVGGRPTQTIICAVYPRSRRAPAPIYARAISRSGRRTPMKLPRRQFLHLAAGAAALPAVSRIAWAQAYPSRPVRIDRRLCRRRRDRHPRAPDRSMAVGAARPAIRHREPAGRRRQYRHRGGRARARRTATRSSWSVRRTRSTRRSTTSSISISSATSRRSRASSACPTSWW